MSFSMPGLDGGATGHFLVYLKTIQAIPAQRTGGVAGRYPLAQLYFCCFLSLHSDPV
jgi:hypothetical protein